MGIESISAIGGLIFIALFVIMLWLSARILSKAGYSGWWSLTLVIPIVGLVMLWVFAFANWPITNRKMVGTSE